MSSLRENCVVYPFLDLVALLESRIHFLIEIHVRIYPLSDAKANSQTLYLLTLLSPSIYIHTAYEGAIEFRSHKDPAFDLIRKEADIGLQVELLCALTPHTPALLSCI